MLSATLLALLLVDELRPASRDGGRRPRARPARTGIPARFWVYAAFAVLYGVCETVNGNWSQLDMTSELGASTTAAAVALTAFWGMVTVGRVLFAAVERRLPPRRTYHALPFVLAAALGLIAILPEGEAGSGSSHSASRGSAARRSCRSRSASGRRS